MEGVEQAGIANPDRDGESPDLPIDSPEVQIALMLFAYGRAHRRKDIIPAHQEQIDLHPDALTEWVKDVGGRSLSKSFRTYVGEHPHIRIDIGDTEALGDTLARVTHTVH